MLAEHSGAVEAALLAEYGIDLLDMWRGTLSVRRVATLVDNLPPKSAVARAIDPDSADWSTTDYLLAQAVDSLCAANWQRGMDAKAPRPEPVPRPGDKKRREAEILRRAQKWQRRQTK